MLPGDEYDELHLPGALHVPLMELNTQRAGALLGRSRAVVVYCWDALGDMSPRAAARLAMLGYDVCDYALSQVDWMAHGLPMEDTRAGDSTARTLICEDVATCAVKDSPDGVALRIDATSYGFPLAISPERVVPGRARRSRLADAHASVEALLEPRPSTIRPDTTIDELRNRLARREQRQRDTGFPGMRGRRAPPAIAFRIDDPSRWAIASANESSRRSAVSRRIACAADPPARPSDQTLTGGAALQDERFNRANRYCSLRTPSRAVW